MEILEGELVNIPQPWDIDVIITDVQICETYGTITGFYYDCYIKERLHFGFIDATKLMLIWWEK
jgi:hypothetical protein